ncbi:uncharacterized protein Tco025E_08017, partial [Trypanosoma conorhini]
RPGDERPMSVQSVGVQSIPDAVVEGGRSLASPAHSVGVRPGDERHMSVQSVGVQSIPDAVVEGGRSLASPAHSVGVRPGDERHMSVQSVGVQASLTPWWREVAAWRRRPTALA